MNEAATIVIDKEAFSYKCAETTQKIVEKVEKKTGDTPPLGLLLLLAMFGAELMHALFEESKVEACDAAD